jgi:para-aminobenzoate synthetase
MRTLIVDNYDSFTFNLFHLFAQVNGEEPVVIRNDEISTLRDLRHFDNVVLSPGPGHPRRRSDFGICGDLIAVGTLPLLGVCLGHQGLCHVHGGEVGPAPEVRHGRLSQIIHRQADIFAKIPSPFVAVRYHSLVVTRLSSDLEPIAWTLDGVLMGVRHRRLPAWGVQFHPESISTEHGRQLAENFCHLSQAWNRRGSPRRASSARRATSLPAAVAPRAPRRLPASPRQDMRVLARRLRAGIGAEQVFAFFYQASRAAFWLDSSLCEPTLGRFSFMGDASGPLARVVKADVWESRITLQSGDCTEVFAGSFFDWLEADLADGRVDVPDLPFDFALGWVGYLGYELKAETGGRRAWRAENPDAAMIFADRAIAFDHQEGEVYLLALARASDEWPARAWLDDTEARLRSLASPAAPRSNAVQQVGELGLRHDRGGYLRLIDACGKAIQEGESYEVCLTNMLTVRASIDAWEAYRYLRRLSPAPFAALLRFDGLSVLSSSPERFLRVSQDRLLESRPIKGTRRRSNSLREDRRLRSELAASEKDRAENLMIVDLVRNDLGICAELGSVHVPILFAVESFAAVHQLVSTVRATLRQDSSAVRCVRAAFPGGSVTGAPKIRTMKIIDELEAGPRGVYCGALGYFSLARTADLSIAIRTLVVTPEQASYGVGGAIVAQSDAAAEYEETAIKAAGMLRLFGARFPDCNAAIGRGILHRPLQEVQS